jgi:hypothetical protein
METPEMISTNCSIGIHTDIFDEKIVAAKKLMNEKYCNHLNAQAHITHLLSPIFGENFQPFLHDFEGYVTTIDPFDVKIKGIEKNNRGLFMLSLESPTLEKIHSDLLGIACKHRYGAVRDKDIERLKTDYYDEKQKEYLYKYGYARVLDLNNPKISLGQCNKEGIDLDSVRKELEEMLIGNTDQTIKVEVITVMLHTNAAVQSDMGILFIKDYPLRK